MIPQRIRERFWHKVDVQHAWSCWTALTSVGSHGYAQIGWRDETGRARMTLMHRVAYAMSHGPIPRGLVVDHLCHNRTCCNPAHLQLLSNEANSARQVRSYAGKCKHGHAYTPENTYRDGKGYRRCRECARARSRKAFRVLTNPDHLTFS